MKVKNGRFLIAPAPPTDRGVARSLGSFMSGMSPYYYPEVATREVLVIVMARYQNAKGQFHDSIASQPPLTRQKPVPCAR